MGWLSPLVFNFAWFANVFYMYGVLSIVKGKLVRISPILAVVLSLDTFRYSQHLLNEGGATTPVYGYGWGAFIWLISIYLLLIAAGTRQAESATSNRSHFKAQGMRVLGIVLIAITAIGTVSLSLNDKANANKEELTRLSEVAFKRGDVCSVEPPSMIEPIKEFSGPLEIRISENSLHANYPFIQIKTLLSWGIPSIRINKQDYYLNKNKLISSPSSGGAQALLEVIEIYGESIQARLTEVKANRIVFDFTWKRQDYPVNTNIYCPGYSSFPQLDELPRSLLVKALDIMKTKIDEESTANVRIKKNRIVNGVIVNRASGGLTRKMRDELWKKTATDKSNQYHHIFNINCPDNIGWDGTGYDASTNTGWPYKIDGDVYYLGTRTTYRSTCEEDAVYIYSMHPTRNDYRINIKKRSKIGFVDVWAGIIIVKGITTSNKHAFYIESVKDNEERALVELVDNKNGDILFIEFPLGKMK